MARPQTFYLISNNKVVGYTTGTDDMNDNESTVNSIRRWVQDGDQQTPPEVRSFMKSGDAPVTTKGPDYLKLDQGRIVLKTQAELDQEAEDQRIRKETIRQNVNSLISSTKQKLVSGQALTMDEADFLLQQKPTEWFAESRDKR